MVIIVVVVMVVVIVVVVVLVIMMVISIVEVVMTTIASKAAGVVKPRDNHLTIKTRARVSSAHDQQWKREHWGRHDDRPHHPLAQRRKQKQHLHKSVQNRQHTSARRSRNTRVRFLHNQFKKKG